MLDDLTQELDFGIDWELANEDAERWARQYGYALVNRLNNTTRRRLAAEIAEWTQNSETINQLAARLSGLFDARRAKTIAVTEVTRAYAQGNQAAWARSKVIDAKRWNTANDELVCPICGPLNGRIVPLSGTFDGIDNPPAHPNCRCWITPVVMEVEAEEEIEAQNPYIVAAKVESEIVHQTHETAAIIDNRGQILFRKDGTNDRVEFSQEEIRQMSGNMITHNHPWGRSFSEADIKILANARAREIRAVGFGYQGKRNVYRLIVESDEFYNYTSRQIEDQFSISSILAKVETDRQIDGQMTRAKVRQLNEKNSHLTIEKFVESLNSERATSIIRYEVEQYDY